VTVGRLAADHATGAVRLRTISGMSAQLINRLRRAVPAIDGLRQKSAPVNP
jgi:hypothetical protein